MFFPGSDWPHWNEQEQDANVAIVACSRNLAMDGWTEYCRNHPNVDQITWMADFFIIDGGGNAGTLRLHNKPYKVIILVTHWDCGVRSNLLQTNKKVIQTMFPQAEVCCYNIIDPLILLRQHNPEFEANI